ncbi:hypothetical protein PR048_026752 [Dryococelus australis]|uniref:Uncharacterized protein n=1 Tax=Dryococelus australis TaxID=614101 RepID=A0ABQ9GM87_9NEOP|nr:hypothetical protein PR048_026752 [Dryococelus australis]
MMRVYGARILQMVRMFDEAAYILCNSWYEILPQYSVKLQMNKNSCIMPRKCHWKEPKITVSSTVLHNIIKHLNGGRYLEYTHVNDENCSW